MASMIPTILIFLLALLDFGGVWVPKAQGFSALVQSSQIPRSQQYDGHLTTRRRLPRAHYQQRQLVCWASQQDAPDTGTMVPVTPCTRICRYNANVFDGQVCIGCFRETYEIGAWQSMSSTEKYYTLLDAVDRLEEAISSTVIDEASTGTSREELMRQAEYWKKVA